MRKIKCIAAGIAAVSLLSACSVTITTNTNKFEDENKIPQVKEEVVSENVSFWGVWCYASKEKKDAEGFASKLASDGFNARVFITSDWEKLNSETYYAVSAGVYKSEEEAKSALGSVKAAGYKDAYVKYSGGHK